MSQKTLTVEDVLDIHERLLEGEPQYSIARNYAISQQSVSAIRTGKAWGHVTGVVFSPNDKRILDTVEVLEIDASLRAGVAAKRLATDYLVSEQAISNIKRGRNWAWLTGRTPIPRKK
jgi:hypothetical protein